MQPGAITRCIAIGWNVLGNHRTRTQDSPASDSGKLMNSDEAADDHIVFNHDMTSQGGAVSDDIMIAQNTVMSDMAIHHQKVAIADPGYHSTAGRPRIDGNELSNGIVVADDKLAGLPFVFQILRYGTYCRKLKYNVSLAESSPPFDHDVRFDTRTLADLYARTDD